VTAALWDAQYVNGDWDYLGDVAQAPRFGVLAAWLRSLASPRVLDVGCGEGTLLAYLPQESINAYTGIDFSTIAIERARSRWHTRDACAFVVGDAAALAPSMIAAHNVVVFNEVLYSLEDPVAVFDNALLGTDTVVFSIFEQHSDTVKLIRTVAATRLVEIVRCQDMTRGKAWVLGMCRSTN